MAQTIKIGVEFFDAQESAKALLDQLRKEVGRFKAGTAISDALVGDIKTLESIIKKLDSSLAKGFNSHGDVNKVVNDFNQISGIYEHVASTIEKTKFQDLNLNFGDFSQLAKDLSQATAELAKFKSQKEQIEQTTIQDLLGKNNKNLSLFSTDQLSTSSITIWNKLTQDLEKYKNSLSDATQKTKELEKIYNDVLSKANTGNQVYKRDNDILSLIGESSKNQADMKTIRGSFIQDIQASLKFDDNKMNLNKAFSVTQKKTLEEWLAPLGLSADSVQNIIATGKSRAEALSEELAKLSYKDIPKVRKAVKDSLAQRTLNDEVTRAKRDYESSEKKKLAKEQTVNETEARIKALETPLQQKNYLSTGSNTTLDQKISNLLSRVQALETQLRQKASSGLNAGVNGSGNIPSVSGEPYHNVLNQQAETADLERQGRAMMKRWIGTRAIINQVRKGIRQAYQDIKSLDAAMTNIAVVTDMSVGDLWDKIDSYMSIAKQYGVTTQGVYEVSQLYYQQGLSTSEVMAATSETLKMARIAGMDYAEAADAMTVAIRAFKMEMSDAQTVTDVYSKVAAITASDSEELAIAMSKTASSAASVGSSFENTTAMLAVMVETTRESAQNLGSALKSIISRYGEMKTGVTVDEDGETIDYNKVDTALKSIGISLKDAQYQFRDFDDVIFELSEKWDSLDKNTQRYIATIMAGNRQQSRFIALVDNWERLDEVATAAQDSEDAGLLQYAKTLDSLETKLNNIKTSFQEFYMSIINGPVISKVLETINSLFEGFNKQGSFAALLDVGSIVSSLTIIGNMFVSIFSGAFGQISANWKAMLQGLPADAAIAGQKAGDQYRNGAIRPKGIGKLGTGAATAASFAGLALTTAGAATTEKYHNNVGAGISAAGNALSYGSMGFMLSGGNPIVTIIAGALGVITSAVSSWRSDLELEQAKLEEATEKAEKANITRAEKKTEYETLKREISNLEELEKARFDSAEAQQEWINANNALFEQFPYLAATFDEVGNATIDLEAAEQALAIARQASLQATIKAAEDEKNRAQQDLNVAKEKQKEDYSDLQSGKTYENAKGKKVRGYNVAQSYNMDFATKGKDFQANGSLEAGLYQWLADIGVGEISANQRGPQGRTYTRNKVVSSSLLSLITRFSETPQDLAFLSNNTEYFKQLAKLDSVDFLSEIVTYGTKNFKLADGSLKYSSTQDLLADWFHGKSYKDLAVEYQAQIDDYISTVQSSVQTIEGLENQVAGADKTLLASKTSQQLRLLEQNQGNKDYDETYGKIAGWDNYVARYVKEAQTAVEEPFDDKRIGEEVEFAVGQWAALEDKLNQSSKLEEYNSLVESFEKGNISIVDYINNLEDLFKETIPDAVQKTQEWAKADVNKNIKNLAQGLVNKAGWSKGGREDWEAETDTLSKTEEWLQSIPENLHQNIVDYVNYVNELVTNAKIEDSKADSMVEAYTGLYDAINSEELKLTPEQKAEAFSILDTADLTSLGGIYDAQNAINKAGISLDKNAWDNILNQVLINLVTETQTLQQKVINAIDNDVKLLKQAYDGVDTAAEAAELASKLGLTLADFESSEGKIRLKKDIDLAEKRKEELQEYKDKIYGTDDNWESGESAYALEYQAADEESGKYDEVLDKYKAEYEAWQKEEGNADKSLQDYIVARRESELAAIDGLFTDFWNQQEKLIKKQSTIDSFYGGEAERKKLSAQKSLASGGQGLSGDTIYDILDAYGLSHDDWQTYFIKNADGTFDIITNSELFKKLDQTTKNAILDKIASNVDSAEQGLQKLGETAVTGKKLDASEIRSLLGAEFDGLNDAQAEVLYTYFKNYAEGTSSKEDLIKVVSLMLRRQASSKGQNLSLEDAKNQAEKYISEIDAELVDAVEANLSKRLELQAKVLQGTATEAEKEALTEAGIDISGLQNKTNKAIINWINSYLKNTDISFDEKVKYTKTAFSTALTNEFGEDIGTLGETAVKGVFGTQDAASDFISKYYTILGQTIDENTADTLVSSWFTRDDSGQYRLKKTIQSLRDELSKIQDSANQEEIDNLEAQLTYYENLQELQHKESLTSSLKSLATSSDNITASQMMSLIQDQGETVSISEAEAYAKDLQNLNPIERLKELVKILKQEHIPVDTDTYQNLVKETITSVMNSASTSISKLGSGMSWNDAFNLTKEIEGLNFSDFEVIGGQYFINNTEKAVKYYQKQVSAAFDEQAKMIEGAADVPVELLQSGDLEAQADLPIADLSGQYKKAQALMQSEYFDETHYKQWLSQAGNKSKDFGQYWQEYINSLDEAAQAAILAWEKEANRQKNIAQYAAKWSETLEDKGVDKTKVEGLDLLKSKGYRGYTEQDMATLQVGGLIKTDEDSLKRIQKQIDAETGTFYLTENDLQPLTAATRNALKLTLDQEVQSAKTAAENLATKMANGTAEFGDYEALFKESITPENFDIIEPLLNQYVEDQSNATDVKNALKRAYPDTEEEDIDAILANWVAFYNDAKHETARSIFDTKIEALSSGYLSEASKETLKKGGASDFVTKFASLAGKAADEIFDAVYEEYEKAYDDGVIKRDEYRTGIAEAASKAFTAKVEAKKPSLYLDDATQEIAGGDALYDADALGSLYAAIADKQKAVKEEVLTFDEFYNQYVNGITEAGEAILDVKALNDANLVSDRRYKEYSSALVDSLFSSAENIITQFKTGDTTGLDLQIQQMFDSLGMALSSEDAAAIVEGGEQVLLNRLIFEINRAGLDTTEVQSRLQELQALILDTITESISSGLSSLGEGIEGTLSEASFLDLQKKYKFENSSYRTSRGVQLSAQNRQDIISGLYGEAKANGRTAGFGEQLLEILNTEGSGIEGYKDIEEAIADANKQIAEGVDGAKEYAEALKLARDAAYEMADAAEFAFMEQDGYDGKANTFDKFTENVTKAKEALATFKKGGKVAHADLTAMFDVIKSSDSGLEAFNNALAGTNLNIDNMLNTALRLNELGEIDIGKVTAEWGIDIETATSAMAEGMSASLQETAKGQIEYLSGLEAMLEAMVALEGIGGIKLDLEFNTGLTDSNGDPIIVKQLSEVYDWWDKLDSDKQKTLQYDIDLTLKNASTQKPLQSFMKGFGLGEADFFTTFFGKGVDSDMEVQLADAFGTLFEQLPNLTAGQAQTVAEEMNRALQGAMLTDKEGNFAGWKDNYIDSLLQFFSTFNLSDIPESLSAEISETLAANNNKITIPVKDGINIAIQSSKDNKGFNVVDAQGNALTGLSDEQISAIKDTLAKDYAMAIENIHVDANTGLVNFYGETVKAETETLKTEFASISEAATGVSDAINKLQTLLSSFQVSDNFRDFVGLMTQLVTGSTGVTKTAEGAQNAANMGRLNAEVDGENERIITLKIDIKEAEESFAEIQTAFDKLVALLSTPITINVNSVGAISGAVISQTDGNTPPNTNPNGGVSSPLSSHTVQVVWDVQQPDFSQIQEPTIGFDWKQPTKAPGPKTLPTINFYWGSALNAPKYTGAAIKIPIEYVESITKDAGAVAWTGTMNDISGAAFADGSIGRLYSGAQLAGKTLVGELGPELAVYDGQYHLLGQHGAEFVNLPSDAIVFNHRQTEGIARGQFNIRGKAMADGNVSGLALAGGSSAAALEAVQRAKSLWQGLLDDLTVAQLAGGSGGGGGGNTLQAVKEELQEWYNLSRQIANVEQEINNLLAERANIPERDGDAYLRSLRQQQELLQEQAAIQEILLGYQELQLQRQAEQINTNKIWSQFLEVDANGLLQYTKGNELFGGKGALEVLSDLNEMSGEEQLKFLKDLGYTARNQDGEELKDSELIQKFYEELQLQIDEYDQLYDTIHETSETLEKLQTEIEEINNEITENQMALEEDIFNILVDAWEEEIEALEEQKDLIEEANDAYVKGLNEALQAERDIYSEEQSIADREQLQRQLSLLRRSGGSASEIANLEKQLDGMLQDEYFRNQEKMIQSVEDANEKQVRQLEQQIRLQKDALDYEEKHGVLWAKVYEIMSGSANQILQFMQGNFPEFFGQSLLQQEKMLTDWARKIGIYTENRSYEDYQSYAQSTVWDTGDIWTYSEMSSYKDLFNSLTAEEQAVARERFNTAYANSSLAGEDHNTAIAKGKASLLSYFTDYKEQQDASQKKPETDEIEPGTGSDSGSNTKQYRVRYIVHFVDGQSQSGFGTGSTPEAARSIAESYAKKKTTSPKTDSYPGGAPVRNIEYFKVEAFAKGGYVDYTGIAMVHGSPSKPEAFLNASQTAQITEALRETTGKESVLEGLRSSMDKLRTLVHSISTIDNSNTQSISIAPGAVVIQVEQLADSYDIEEVSRDVMNRMVAIANKATNRGVNRR